MDSIVKKLSEIESAASSIVEHAEAQKEVLDKEYQEKRRLFDIELERFATILKLTPRTCWMGKVMTTALQPLHFKRIMKNDTPNMPKRF